MASSLLTPFSSSYTLAHYRVKCKRKTEICVNSTSNPIRLSYPPAICLSFTRSCRRMITASADGAYFCRSGCAARKGGSGIEDSGAQRAWVGGAAERRRLSFAARVIPKTSIMVIPPFRYLMQ
ncbi:MAG: hypothetical protein J5998_09465, partial [Clostridia bacterium]|nr:hypothetical protein [Clostridia bacterium]